MVIASEQLIDELTELTGKHIAAVRPLMDLSTETLTWRNANQSWNILECLEHLNLYGNFYLPEIAGQINSSGTQPDARFKSGWLGNYFANSMWPKEQLNKMKTFKSMNPIHRAIGREVIHIFLEQQTRMLQLLQQARVISLNKVKTRISISKFIKLKLGDTLRIVIYHNERHLHQIEKILTAMKNSGRPVAIQH